MVKNVMAGFKNEITVCFVNLQVLSMKYHYKKVGLLNWLGKPPAGLRFIYTINHQ